jgi:histidinol phosphatase-like enzyme (inositol monophosphatase family)
MKNMARPLFDVFLDIADAAAAASLPHFRTVLSVSNKLAEGFDPVTEADTATERAIRALIESEFPEDGILGEEFGMVRADAPYRWVIDPIDGTRAFISGLPVWGTLVGRLDRGKAVAGMMAQPFTGEVFIADGTRAERIWRGVSAPLKASGCKRLSEAKLFTTSPHLFQGELRKRFDALETQVRLFRYGTDCYAFAMVAAGFADLVIDPGLKPYDIVGLIPLIEQAGGVVATLAGGPPEEGGDIIAAATPELLNAAMAVMKG